MTVRWKPLIVLSGLFLVIAALGLMAVTFELVPSGSADILPAARTEWKAGRFTHAKIHFQRALQKDPKNAEIYAELARMLDDWAKHEPSLALQLRSERLRALADAATHARQSEEPRRLLVADALLNDESAERWAKELVALNPADSDAHFALAIEALDAAPADIDSAKTHLEALEAREPERLRTAWIQARVAEGDRDQTRLDAVLGKVRAQPMAEGLDPLDRWALLRLRQIDTVSTTEPATLITRIKAFEAAARAMAEGGKLPSERLAKLGNMLEDVQKHLQRLSGTGDAPEMADVKKAAVALQDVAEATYKQALETANAADLRVHQEYAAYLLFREKREECLDRVTQALKLPAASLAVWTDTVAQLRETGIKAALSNPKAKDRYAKAEPFIKALLESNSKRDQALGHLFQGVIELERSGLADATREVKAAETAANAKPRAAALSHLKLAADGLPSIPTAQALYGVALLLSGESALGRQYLQAAQRLPNIEAQYQVWASWAMVQSGYPEDAEPIVHGLLEAIAQGKQTRDLEPTLHLLMGEIHQARRTPEALRAARAEYQKAIAGGQPETGALQLRLAQIDLLLGDREAGNRRIEQLKSSAGGAAAEHLAVLALMDQNKTDEARKQLQEARRHFPDSMELLGLDVSLCMRENQPEQADQLLDAFLKGHPKNLDAIQLRARLLAGPLKKVDEARALLVSVADDAETSAPLVQLALLDLSRRDDEAVTRTIKRIRTRWKEAAAADLLDAQLALAKNQLRAASVYLDAALRKDPGNKIALFWKAQLDDRNGASAQAAKVFEDIVRERPVKELEDGLSLTTAANWALATMALENQDVDNAINRLEGLLKGGEAGELARSVRWQLAAARDAKGQWPAARAEIESLLKDLKDLKDPVAVKLERVRAANFYRMHNDTAAATVQLDQVLKNEPGYSPAVALKAYILAEKAPADGSALIRKAIAAKEQPASIYLMLAALENISPPVKDGVARARTALEAGLKQHPDSIELIQAMYRVQRLQGDKSGAIAFVEARAKNDPKGIFRRFLVDVYRDEARYTDAERVVTELMKQFADDPQLALMHVRLVAFEAMARAGRGDRKAEEALNARTVSLLAEYQKKFPNEPSFLQAECELAARAGKLDKAAELTRAIDAVDKNSPTGPLLRAQLAAARGWTREVAEEYAQAVARAPKRADLRLALGEANLAIGKHDDALRQANWLLEANPTQPAAIILKARSLAQQEGGATQVAARRAEAIKSLRSLLASQPTYSAAYHLIAEIQVLAKARPDAIATLKAGLKAVPKDATGLSLLVQMLSEPREQRQPAPRKDVQEAMALAEQYGGQSNTPGDVYQALAAGFHRAGQVDLALPWAEKAAGKLDTWVAHLSYGDILLAKAEATTDRTSARALFEKAVAQYDLVLKTQATSIEAVNNKAWILHEYLNRDPEALELAEGLARRLDPATLPAEFHDTLGAIQESMNRPKEAEDAYQNGLRKVPDHPILNFHMGKLLAANPDRAADASTYLKKAQAGRDQLPPRLASEVDALVQRSAQP